MVYFSGAEGSPAYNKAREFSQKISTVGVDGRNKESWLFLWGVREREVAGVISLSVHDPLYNLTALLSHVQLFEHVHT